MKRIFNLAMAASVAVLMASCAKDAAENAVPGPEPGVANKFTFVLPAQSGIITYVAAEGDESKLNLANTTILMFNNDSGDTDYKKLEAVITGSNILQGTRDGKPTAEIEVDDSWSGNKMFYIVGNTDKGASTVLPTVGDIGTYEVDDLLAEVTEAQSAALSSTNGLLLSGNVPVTSVETTSEAPISLYRSVARFDIDNDVTANHVTIKRIDVVGANNKGYVVGYGRNASSTLTNAADKIDLNNITVSQTTTKIDVNNTPADDTDDHDFQQQKSVFYLYPTNLKAENADGTVITLVGEDQYGDEKIYTLNKEASDLSIEDCEIKANTRYIISAIDPLNLTFIITVEDWDDGDKLVGRPDPNGGSFGVADIDPTSVGTFNGVNTIQVPTSGGTVKFTIKATSSKGTSFVISDAGTGAMVDISSSITATQTPGQLVYSMPYFESKYEVEVPALNANETSVTKITITDIATPSKSLDFYIYHEAEDGSVILINEVTFPDPVFRNYVENTFGLTGTVSEAQLNTVKNIDLKNRTDIKNISGINYFSKLTSLNVGNTRISALDVSKNTELTTLYFGDTEISTIDVSNNLKLTKLDLNRTKITFLDISKNVVLQELYCAVPGITSINLNNNPELNYLGLNNTGISHLDVSNNPLLATLGVENCNLTDLDLTHNSALINLYATGLSVPSLDVSHNTELKILALNESNISSLDVSTNPKLVNLNVGNTSISTLNVTNNPLLTHLYFTGTLVTNIDLSSQTELLRMNVGYLIESIDISKATKLEMLAFGVFDKNGKAINKDSAIKSLDISANTKINDLRIYNCPNLSKVYVWDGFDVNNPAQHFTGEASVYPGLVFELKQ